MPPNDKAMSYKRMKQLEKQPECEIEQLMALGQEQDEKDAQSTIDLPAEIKRRKDRLSKINTAQKVIEQRGFDQCYHAQIAVNDDRGQSLTTYSQELLDIARHHINMIIDVNA